MHHPQLEELVEKDSRYAYEAYEFVFQALAHTQAMLGKLPEGEDDPEEQPIYHVSGQELLEGIRDLALREYGMMARTVFAAWGIHRTGDFGEIVFNLIEANLMSKTDRDNRKDFEDVYDLDEALVHEIIMDEVD